MTITYPLALPTSPELATIRIYRNDLVGGRVSPFTAQQQLYDWQSGFWRADVTYTAMYRATAEQLLAFLGALRGRAGTFTMGDPGAITPRGTLGGTPLVNGAGQGGYTLALDGATASITGWLKAGDYIQVGNYMYKVLVDANTNGSGQATLDIWPRLRSAPADNAAIITSNTKGLWRLVSNESSWDESPGIIYRGMSFSAVEAI